MSVEFYLWALIGSLVLNAAAALINTICDHLNLSRILQRLDAMEDRLLIPDER
ncbi:hypothetical protein [Streptomyces sp. UNOC14_S4]|uniref:hypothetical protein n=1 Tax=Streptomyces sp. UNOC14_S4 TaxID=2872340 RepID=UPI001E4120DE|nr:hypothetical protein [Streptomyces sp. UNOC14_S4]MCC3766020.1 hypothetical protein [Streptomyces sp. UNOC14_S4]